MVVVFYCISLEELGLKRYGRESFKTPPTENIDAITMEPKVNLANQKIIENLLQQYAMITGDIRFSPNNKELLLQI